MLRNLPGPPERQLGRTAMQIDKIDPTKAAMIVVDMQNEFVA
jgi:isochorismate hydrolase